MNDFTFFSSQQSQSMHDESFLTEFSAVKDKNVNGNEPP